MLTYLWGPKRKILPGYEAIYTIGILPIGPLMVSEVRSKERDPQVGDPCAVDLEGFYFLSFLDEFFLGSCAGVLNSLMMSRPLVSIALVSSEVFPDAIEAKL